MADVPDAPALHAQLLRHLNPPYIRETGETAWVYVEDALPARAALRAVVELHAPEPDPEGYWPAQCFACSSPPTRSAKWPCVTIGRVASALGVETAE